MKNITKNVLLSLFLGLFAFSNVLVLIPANVALAGPNDGGNPNKPEEKNKINICHKNGDSGTWNALSVDENGWNGHDEHDDDYLYNGPIVENGPKKGQPTNDGDNWCKNNAPIVIIDTDEDGIPDDEDNCPIIPNPDQADGDGDGVGDVCDNCPAVVNQDQMDADEDGVGDICQVIEEDTATIYATKIVCDSEEDLPNWGAGDVISNINRDTATNYVADSNDKCRIVPWDFEWSYRDIAGDPADNEEGGAGSSWTTFSNETPAIIDISEDNKIGIREIYDSRYIPFTGENTTENISAEFYCGSDVLHYDNWEWLDVKKDTDYYCVAFNVPKMCSVVSDTTNIVEDGVAAVETWNHGNWYDETLLGNAAKWIWETLNIVDPVGTTTKVFVKEFSLDAVPVSASIEVAADNSFVLEINGDEIASDGGENNFGSIKTYQVTNLTSGTNTIRMTVTNKAQANGTPTSNPAGALYKLTVLGSDDCENVTPVDMCLNFEGHQSFVPEGLERDNEGNCVEPGPQLTCDPEVNLLANGGFELPVVNNSNKWDTFVSGTASLGWIVEWISGGLGSLELQAGVNSWLPNEGNQYAELDSTAATKIWQDIPTIPGKTYKLEFAYSPRPKVVDNGIEVYGDGILLGTLLADGSSNNNTSWTTKTYTFTADNETRIEFKDISNSDSYGGFLDNVGLYCQNESNEPFLRSAEITNPSEGENVSGMVSFTANLIDKDNDDSVQWAVRKGTCAAGTGTVFGNVDGHSDSYSWDHSNFEATTDVSSWENGVYCFVFNPSETTGDTPIRETREFNVLNQIQEYDYVTTNSATSITETSATLNGTNGDVVATNEAFWYGTTIGGPFVPAVGDASSQYPSGWTGFFASNQNLGIGGAFSHSLNSLTPNTKYYFVAWSFVGGTWYPGEVLSFTTESSNEPEQILGCTDDDYDNYNPNATEDDGSCANQPKKTTTQSGSYVTGSVLGAFTTGGEVLGAEASCGIYVDKYIRRGYQNDPETVKKIQRFLNNYMGSNLVEDGKFGLKTEKALMAFQEKHKDDVLTPWGLKGPTGIFYITTQTKVNNIMCPELNLQIPTLIPFEFNPKSPNKA